ncbi:MAG: hypothetical protein RI988_1811 [Pseudomonadota bacterium]
MRSQDAFGEVLASGDVNIFVAAHTNVGKTALLRTLIGKDVGEVEDAPNVTTAMEAYDIVSGGTEGSLLLWDTPGFQDSFRLARRLRIRYRWVAWLVREAWDRYRNPRLWKAQRLVHHMRAYADVILYPVNVLERPVDAAYVRPELDALSWVGKPVLAVLNQGGTLTENGEMHSRINEWRNVLVAHPAVRAVFELDAFTRCWIQEVMLFSEITNLLPEGVRARYEHLRTQLTSSHVSRFHESVACVADALVRTAADKSEVESGLMADISSFFDRLIRSPTGREALKTAGQPLAQRLAERTRDLAQKLVEVNRLEGASSDEVLSLVASRWVVNGPINTPTPTLVGGLVSGLLTGLAADLMAGGLTLGTGALVGGVLGALGGAGIAGAYNASQSDGGRFIRWSRVSLEESFKRFLRLYLSVAHFGRGQGAWSETEEPQRWEDAVCAAIESRKRDLDRLWGTEKRQGQLLHERDQYVDLVSAVLIDVLRRIHPQAGGVLVDLQRYRPGSFLTQRGESGLLRLVNSGELNG